MDNFEADRSLYYSMLSNVHKKNDLESWIKYFLQGVCDVANATIEKLKKIDALNSECKATIALMGQKSTNTNKLLEIIYTRPDISVNEAQKALGTSYQVASNLVNAFVEHNILIPKHPDKARNKRFVFRRYLDLFK